MKIEIIIEIILAITTVIGSFIGYYFYIKSEIEKQIAEAINEAEIPEKVGEEKLSLVVDKIYSIVPGVLKFLFTKDKLKIWVQKIFDSVASFAAKKCEKK